MNFNLLNAPPFRAGLFTDLPIITFEDKGRFVSYVPFLYVTGIGKTRDVSIKDLMDGIETYFHGEDARKILREKIPVSRSPVSVELLRFNVVGNKMIPATGVL